MFPSGFGIQSPRSPAVRGGGPDEPLWSPRAGRSLLTRPCHTSQGTEHLRPGPAAPSPAAVEPRSTPLATRVACPGLIRTALSYLRGTARSRLRMGTTPRVVDPADLSVLEDPPEGSVDHPAGGEFAPGEDCDRLSRVTPRRRSRTSDGAAKTGPPGRCGATPAGPPALAGSHAPLPGGRDSPGRWRMPCDRLGYQPPEDPSTAAPLERGRRDRPS